LGDGLGTRLEMLLALDKVESINLKLME
jgi:hypothetical protein